MLKKTVRICQNGFSFFVADVVCIYIVHIYIYIYIYIFFSLYIHICFLFCFGGQISRPITFIHFVWHISYSIHLDLVVMVFVLQLGAFTLVSFSFWSFCATWAYELSKLLRSPIAAQTALADYQKHAKCMDIFCKC